MRIQLALILCLLALSMAAQDHPFYSPEDPVIKEKLSVVDPVEYQGYFFSGLKYKLLGDPQMALQQFKNCIRLDGSEPAPMYESAMIHLQLGQIDEALFFIESACKIETKNKWYLHLLATTYLESSKYVKAISTYKNLLEIEPYNEDWTFELATAYILNNQYRNAIKAYDQLEKIVGPNELLFQQKKQIYLDLGDKSSAIREIEKWTETEPKNVKAYNQLAELYLLIGKQDKTIETLEKVLDIDPNNPNAFIILSDLYRNKKDYDNAFEYTLRAFASKALNIDAKMRTLLSYYEWTDTDTLLLKQAYRLIDTLIVTHPEDAKPYTIAGDYYYRDDSLKQAQLYFRKATELDPSRYPIWQQLMIISFDLKDYDEVVVLSEASQELFPSQPTSYYFGGLAHLQLKQFASAVDQLNTGKLMVIGNDPLLAQFYASLGDAYNALKEFSDSDRSYNKSLVISPDNTYVLNNYSYYLSLRKEKLEEAEQMMQKCIALDPSQSSYLDTYAWVLYQQKKYKKALEWLEKSLDNGGASSATIVEHYGDVLFQLGREQEALKEWNTAKELGSDSEWIDKKIRDKKLYE